MSQFPVITRPANSRTGKLQFIEQSNALFAQPKSLKRSRVELALRFLWAVTISLGVGGAVHEIVRGLPGVLQAHGIH